MHKTIRYTKKEYKQKQNRVGYIFIIGIIVFMGLFIFIHIPIFHSSYPQSPLGNNTRSVFSASKVKSIPQPQEQNSVLLGALINHVLLESNGVYGIVVRNLRTNESYYYNAHQEFETASLYKLWIMATVFSEMKKGKIHATDVLSEDVDILDALFNIGTDSARTTFGTVSMTVNQALTQMITVSDNDAALLLSERVKLALASKFLDQHGFTESKFGTDTDEGLPVTSAFDIALFFEKLYAGRLIDPTTDSAMIALLKQQRMNDKIPKFLPPTVNIAHKTGELDPYSHDAGIIYTKQGDYILVVLSESNSRPQADAEIAKISQAVFNYFTPEKKQH